MANANSVDIPVPMGSGATDQPDIQQHGVPAVNNFAGVKLDMSTSKPISASTNKFAGVKLDMSTSKPLPTAAGVGPTATPAVLPPAAQPKAPAYAPTPGLISRIVGEATEAYHHPWEAAKGAAKGLADVAGAVIPGVQSESIDPNDPNFKNNPYISQRVKGLLST
ncbi:MAG: hypothetical protein ABSG90_14535, partial [Dehalococcoidia bacterium]